ncbi:hypothetical protein F5Y11DRAFT_364034 [Daldinia sp. FL1419]|nr:hypothetical protein F5Y11DRAFT_364034 [Daldinia sp. FL1419]
MFARLHSDSIPSSLKPHSPAPLKSFKRRLGLGEDEDENIRPPSPKKHRKAYYSIAPLPDKYRRPRIDKDNPALSHTYNRRQRLSPSPSPDPPLVSEIGERYATLRATLHSAAISGLEEVETELVAQSDASIRANRKNLVAVEAQLNKLISPLQDLTVDYTATGEDGRERTAAEETQVEIKGLGEETLSRKGSDPADEEIRLSGTSVVSGISPSASDSHVAALAAFGSDLDRADKDVVEEMITYEEKFLKEIEQEAGNILHSFLNR